MDESGFAIGSTPGACIIIDSQIRSQFQARPGRQEWVTVIECICGDGTILPPLVIFKGANLNTEWLTESAQTPGWKFSTSNKGWTSDIHSIQWLTRCFEPATREKADGGYRVLILDGHSSHVTVDFINHCCQHKILLLRLIPHTSHLCQPLDVSLFGPLKHALSAEIQPLIQTKVSKIHKPEWLAAFVHTRQIAFSHSNILGGWCGAGLLPFDPEKVLRHIEIPPPPAAIHPSSLTLPMAHTSLDPALFNSSLLTSSPLNTESFHKTASALWTHVEQNKVLATPVHQLIPRLATTTQKLHAENSILRTQLKSATDILSARKEHKKGL